MICMNIKKFLIRKLKRIFEKFDSFLSESPSLQLLLGFLLYAGFVICVNFDGFLKLKKEPTLENLSNFVYFDPKTFFIAAGPVIITLVTYSFAFLVERLFDLVKLIIQSILSIIFKERN